MQLLGDKTSWKQAAKAAIAASRQLLSGEQEMISVSELYEQFKVVAVSASASIAPGYMLLQQRVHNVLRQHGLSRSHTHTHTHMCVFALRPPPCAGQARQTPQNPQHPPSHQRGRYRAADHTELLQQHTARRRAFDDVAQW